MYFQQINDHQAGSVWSRVITVKSETNRKSGEIADFFTLFLSYDPIREFMASFSLGNAL